MYLHNRQLLIVFSCSGAQLCTFYNLSKQLAFECIQRTCVMTVYQNKKYLNRGGCCSLSSSLLLPSPLSSPNKSIRKYSCKLQHHYDTMKTHSLLSFLGITFLGLSLLLSEVSGNCISGGGSCDSNSDVGCCRNHWCKDGTCVGFSRLYN